MDPSSANIDRAREAASALDVLPSADTLFFDSAPVFSHAHGVLSVTLTATRFLPDGRGGVVNDEVVVGILRSNVPAARALITAIENAILLAQPAQGSSN